MHLNPLKLKTYFMNHQFNIQQFYVLPTQSIYMFFVDLRTILTRNFSKEQYLLPEDDLRIETCRSILSVLAQILDKYII